MKRLFITLFIATVFMFVVSASADTLTLPAGIEVIGQEAFYGDSSLDVVALGSNITEIGVKAFAKSSLTHVTMPMPGRYSTATFTWRRTLKCSSCQAQEK